MIGKRENGVVFPSYDVSSFAYGVLYLALRAAKLMAGAGLVRDGGYTAQQPRDRPAMPGSPNMVMYIINLSISRYITAS